MASGCHTGQGKTKSEKNLGLFFFLTRNSTITGAAYCILEIEAALRGER